MDWNIGLLSFGSYGYNPEGIRIGQQKNTRQSCKSMGQKII